MQLWARSLRSDAQNQVEERKAAEKGGRKCDWEKGCGDIIPETVVHYLGTSGEHTGKLVCPVCARRSLYFRGLKGRYFERKRGKKRPAQRARPKGKQKRAKKA